MNTGAVYVFLDRIKTSYWFIPGVMGVISIVAGLGLVYADRQISFPKGMHFITHVSAEGARSLLSVIAGSLITVASVAFSMTLLALSHVSSQYGPRIFANLMRDRGSQFTLGIFTSTFIYSLLVLRTVRGASDDGYAGFVPNIAIFVAFLLCLICVATLIYFFHHVPESMRLSEIVRNLGSEFKSKIKDVYPEEFHPGLPEDHCQASPLPQSQFEDQEFTSLPGKFDGFVQSTDLKYLVQLATETNVEMRLLCRPGAFVCEGEALLEVAPAHRLSTALIKKANTAFTIGKARTSVQDSLFPAEQLVEIATRALSPGVNEPSTAITCMNWLEAGLSELSRRKANPSWMADDDHNLRITLSNWKSGFSHSTQLLFGSLQQYVAADRQAGQHYIQVMKRLAKVVRTPEQRAIVTNLAEQMHHLQQRN